MIKHIINRMKSRLVSSFVHRLFINHFEFWQARGMHVLPVNFSSPIPDTRELTASYPKPTQMSGIEMNDAKQREFLDLCATFQSEYNDFVVLNSPTLKEVEQADTFVLNNPFFAGIDPHMYYSMIRHYKPARIVEVGSGNSTRVAQMALDKNSTGDLTCIEPYPTELLLRTERINIVQCLVENVDLEFFDQLEANDILFIDSSHVFRIGGDVSFLFLEVLPRLKPGVLVHVHDIFFPQQYSKDWVVDQRRFYGEQHILQAYLIGNSKVEVLFANHYMAEKEPDLLKQTFPKALYYLWSGSFWFKIC